MPIDIRQVDNKKLAMRRELPYARPNLAQDKIRTRIIWSVTAVALLGLGILIVLVMREPAPIPGLQLYGRQLRGHDNSVTIPTGDLPPVGGVHHDAWQMCGIYTEPIAPENAVHSIEHGAVWITYQPGLPADQVEQLQELMRGEPYLLLSPYPGQRSPIVLTAWAVQLEVEDAADPRISTFIRRYRLGPSTPERGGACGGSGGVGTPVE